MTLKLKIQELYMVLVKRFFRKYVRSLCVFTLFVCALLLKRESARKKCKDTERARTKSVKTQREHAFLFQFVYVYFWAHIILAISYGSYLYKIFNVGPTVVNRLTPDNRPHLHE